MCLSEIVWIDVGLMGYGWCVEYMFCGCGSFMVVGEMYSFNVVGNCIYC